MAKKLISKNEEKLDGGTTTGVQPMISLVDTSFPKILNAAIAAPLDDNSKEIANELSGVGVAKDGVNETVSIVPLSVEQIRALAEVVMRAASTLLSKTASKEKSTLIKIKKCFEDETILTFHVKWDVDDEAKNQSQDKGSWEYSMTWGDPDPDDLMENTLLYYSGYLSKDGVVQSSASEEWVQQIVTAGTIRDNKAVIFTSPLFIPKTLSFYFLALKKFLLDSCEEGKTKRFEMEGAFVCTSQVAGTKNQISISPAGEQKSILKGYSDSENEVEVELDELK